MTDLLTLLDWNHRNRVAGTNGGEYAGPCPKQDCLADHDGFRVWPTPRIGRPRFWCRQCGWSGDDIQFCRDLYGDSYVEACRRLGEHPGPFPDMHVLPPPVPPKPVEAPSLCWQASAEEFVEASQSALWGNAGARART